MPDPTTTNYGWTMPAVGGDTNAWGSILNALFAAIDSTLFGVDTMAKAALPKAGGALTGRLDALTSTAARADLGVLGASQALDLSVANLFDATISQATAFSISNVPAGTVVTAFMLRLTNGGSAPVTWPAAVKWSSGNAPALTAAGVDLLGFVSFDNGASWIGYIIAKDVR